MRLVIATHTREMKTSLFLALNALKNVSIVATANSTGELISYCRALRPDVVVVESGLPGQSLEEAIDRLDELMSGGRILLIDGADADEVTGTHSNVEQFSGVDLLIEAVP